MKLYKALVGNNVSEAIADSHRLALESRQQVGMHFNGVDIVVESKSRPSLIYRDWSLAMEGCLPNHVGPLPLVCHSETSEAHFAAVRADNKRRQEKRQAEYDKANKAKRYVLSTALLHAEPIQLCKPKEWAEHVGRNSDPYGAACVKYAEQWALMMQVKIKRGYQLTEVAEKLSHEADVDGITGVMYCAAVSMLSECWIHGEELRKWHNGEYNHDGDGVVNPAVLTINV